MKKLITALSLSVLAASTSFADDIQSGSYIGASYAINEADAGGDDLDLSALMLNAGYRFNEYFSAEARIGTGTGGDDLDDFYGIDIDIDSMYGVYGKVGIPTGTAVYPYAILGYTNVKLELSGGGTSESDDDSDLSYGIGADFSVSESFSMFAEYIVWYDDNDIELSGFNLGVNLRF